MKPYPKFDWTPYRLPEHMYRRIRYVCGKCGWGDVPATKTEPARVLTVMKITAERHYQRCQLGVYTTR